MKAGKQPELQEEAADLMGQIVGFDNGRAITADEWKRDQSFFQSPSAISAQRKSGGGPIDAASSNYSARGAPAGIFYDLNGNVLSLPRFAFGTDHVPRIGPAIVHNGECIIPAGQNAAVSAPVIVNGGITINRPNVTRADDNDAIARGVDAAQ